MPTFTFESILIEDASDAETGPEGRYIHPVTVTIVGSADLEFGYGTNTADTLASGFAVDGLNVAEGSFSTLVTSAFEGNYLNGSRFNANSFLNNAIFGSASVACYTWNWNEQSDLETSFLVFEFAESDNFGYTISAEILVPVAGDPLPDGWSQSFTDADWQARGACDAALDGLTFAAKHIGTYDPLGGVDDPVTIFGTDGNDVLEGGRNADFLDGVDGFDTLRGGGGNDSIIGRDGNDVIRGGQGNDQIAGGNDKDEIKGGVGHDFIGGGLGDDTIDGGIGNDVIGAGQGDDSASGASGNDIVNGGAGDDQLSGGDGNDTMGGGFGIDIVEGDAGDDSLGGGNGMDTLDGGSGADTMGGGEGDDLVRGGNDDDFVAGGAGNDVVRGGSGDDRINGGDGNDTMSGGPGADVFIYNSFKEGDADMVTDFEVGVDRFRMAGVEMVPGSGLVGRIEALNITETANGALIDYMGQTVLILGVAATALGIDDFDFV